MATAPAATSTMSTIKTDSRARVRLFRCHGRPAPMFRMERLLEAQSRRMIVIIIAVPAEQPVAGFFIARNRPRVVLMDFESHRPALAAPRRLLGCCEEQRPDPAPADMGSDGDGIKPRDHGTRWIKHQRVAGECSALLGDDQ